MIPKKAPRAHSADMPFENNDEDPAGEQAGEIAEMNAKLIKMGLLSPPPGSAKPDRMGPLSNIDLTEAEGPPKKGALE